jgi:hypothetical protein
MTLAMLAKNGAWYISPAVFPSTDVSFDNVGQMAALVVKRTALAMAMAATLEYPLATDGQRRFKNAGARLNELQGYTQVIDQFAALGMQSLVNKVTGQAAPPGYQFISYALSAIGAAIQTGALNGPILNGVNAAAGLFGKAAHGADDDKFVPIDITALKAKRSQIVQGQARELQSADVDLEQGFGVSGSESGVRKLLDDFSSKLDRMTTEVAEACQSLSKLQAALIHGADSTETVGVRPAAAMPSSMNGQELGRFVHDVGAIRNAVEQYAQVLDPTNADDRERLAQIKTALAGTADVENTIVEMSKDADRNRAGFFAAMATLSAIGTALGAVGPSVHSEWLSNINHRAAIFGVTSSVLQAFANLGQFLGGAKPEDGMLQRILKVGLDKDDNKYQDWAKNWFRSVRFLLGEFPLLQLSTTFSEMAAKYAGERPDAPAHGIPSPYTIRNIQEAFRAAFSLAFTTMALGEEAQWNHYLGVGVSALGAGITTGVEVGTQPSR